MDSFEFSILSNYGDEILENLFPSSTPKQGSRTTNTQGMFVVLENRIDSLSISEASSSIIEFTMNFSAGVTTGVIANYLYTKLSKLSSKMWINEEEIEITYESINRVVVKKMKRYNSDS